MDPKFKPVARTEGLVVQEMPDEVLVYDMKSNQAHCLNTTAAFIWQSCSGTNSVSDIERMLAEKNDVAIDVDLVRLGIDELATRGLINNPAPASGLNRREVIKRIGLASVIAVPVVASLVTPKSAFAATSCACGTPGDCLTQSSCPSTVNCNGLGRCAP